MLKPAALPFTNQANIEAKFLFAEPLASYLAEALSDDISNARLSRLFQVFYRVRPFLPIPVRQALQRLRNGSKEYSQIDFQPSRLLDLLEAPGAVQPSLWPDNQDYAFVLTHDVETKQGVRLIQQLAEIEEQLGFRSCWNIVPYKYKTDAGLIRDLKDRGHEVGVHGYNHDGRLFLNKRIFDSRVAGMNRAIEEIGAVGFRTPMVHRNLNWMQQLNVEYDSSVFDADPFQAMPGGVGSFWPFIYGKFVELPYTMPQDHTLFVTLGETTDAVWRDKLTTIRGVHGMSLMVTHPDYLDSPSRLNIYRDFLKFVRDTTDPWHVLPMEMARWCRQFVSGD